MGNFHNSARAIGIHFAIMIVTFLLIDICSIDFESGKELYMIALLMILYTISGFVFLDTKQRVFMSLCLFLLYFIIITVFLTLGGDFALYLLVVNPIGLVLTSLMLDGVEIAPIIVNVIAAIFPPLLLYCGLKLRMVFNEFRINQ